MISKKQSKKKSSGAIAMERLRAELIDEGVVRKEVKIHKDDEPKLAAYVKRLNAARGLSFKSRRR